ncbi:MAG: TetR/AcrR family transcriptional regulator [Nocardioides sp.]
MVASAATLIRRHGASGTSIDRVLALSGAPRGSVYHHFPGGRSQLVEEAVRYAGGYVADLIDQAATTGDPVAVVETFLALWREQLVASDYRAGCPVVAVAIESHDDAPQLARATREVFARWQGQLAAVLTGRGLSATRAHQLATFALAAVEGALVLSRAEHGTHPLDDVGTELRGVLRAALPAGPEEAR